MAARDPSQMVSAMDPSAGAVRGTVGLPTGEAARIRPIRADDAPRLQALFARLSPATRYRRFFSHRRALPAAAAARFAEVDARTRLAVVAERPTPAGPELVGVARCDVVDPRAPRTAGVAMVVEDRFQHAGLGRALLRALVAAARAQGVTRFEGDLLTENHPVLAFVRSAGFPVTLETRGSEIHFTAEIGAGTGTDGDAGR